ncbi:hypothetical protein FCU94_06270 [Vibrio sp. JPW-9-11-11]|uniref:hypothetical protein n=1 Tax=Vibrio sp. JPW-9-11-11 TaxID=1416532 RepID=UPI001592B7E1|nr:hypothetical protein [Vibrio sp. JPW-9-11-11]NVD06514.1 hypothetical protein [Vibrio sp. JPW-9-11-11]
MQQQRILIDLSSRYPFLHANQHLSNPDTRPFARSWLAIDLSAVLSQVLNTEIEGFAVPYTANDKFYKYDQAQAKATLCEKRFASKADLALKAGQGNDYFEFHYLHQRHLADKKATSKLKQDVDRVRALRSATKQNVYLAVALWGTFSAKEAELFHYLDNNTYAAYALDTSLTGSSQVSRLVHVQKTKLPRMVFGLI